MLPGFQTDIYIFTFNFPVIRSLKTWQIQDIKYEALTGKVASAVFGQAVWSTWVCPDWVRGQTDRSHLMLELQFREGTEQAGTVKPIHSLFCALHIFVRLWASPLLSSLQMGCDDCKKQNKTKQNTWYSRAQFIYLTKHLLTIQLQMISDIFSGTWCHHGNWASHTGHSVWLCAVNRIRIKTSSVTRLLCAIIRKYKTKT